MTSEFEMNETFSVTVMNEILTLHRTQLSLPCVHLLVGMSCVVCQLLGMVQDPHRRCE
jgi:hypothetical protein